MQHSLEQLRDRLRLNDRVVFAGYAPIDQIWATNHALVLPSRVEGMPLVIVEAMLCARPVVATDVSGNGEIIEDGVTGFLADAPTVESVAKALEHLWLRREEAEAIGKAGAERIRLLRPSDPTDLFAGRIQNLANVARAV
jgi:glycosyltransferase involved in cell wall biosynthesis